MFVGMQMMSPLSSALAGKDPDMGRCNGQKLFRTPKTALARAAMLTYLCHNVQTSLTEDASESAVGAVLQQSVQGVWRPLVFFSKQLHPPESKYSAFDRELLALYLGV